MIKKCENAKMMKGSESNTFSFSLLTFRQPLKHKLTHTLSFSFGYTHIHTLPFNLSLSHTHFHFFPLSFSLFQMQYSFLTFPLSLFLSLFLSLSLSLSHSLSLAFTHTNSHSFCIISALPFVKVGTTSTRFFYLFFMKKVSLSALEISDQSDFIMQPDFSKA